MDAISVSLSRSNERNDGERVGGALKTVVQLITSTSSLIQLLLLTSKLVAT